MIFAMVQRSDPDNVFAIVRNVSGATITAGYPVVFDISATIDGNRVSKPATASLSCLVGIADETKADQGYMRVQKYGYRSAAYITPTTTTAIVVGDVLIPVDSAWHLARYGAGNGYNGMLLAGEAIATVTAGLLTAGNYKVLIKCM